MGGQTKAAVTINPTVGFGLAPVGLLVDTPKAFWNDALIFLFLMPERTLGPIHHFIGTDHPVMARVQETTER